MGDPFSPAKAPGEKEGLVVEADVAVTGGGGREGPATAFCPKFRVAVRGVPGLGIAAEVDVAGEGGAGDFRRGELMEPLVNPAEGPAGGERGAVVADMTGGRDHCDGRDMPDRHQLTLTITIAWRCAMTLTVQVDYLHSEVPS